MLRSCWLLVLSLAVALFACSDSAYAGQGKGGGAKGGGKGGGGKGVVRGRNADDDMRWYGSLAAAEEAAKAEDLPVMAVLRRLGSLDDQEAVEKLASWPQVGALSKEGMAAVRLNADGSKAEALSSKLKLPSLPGIIWLDQYGNPILGQSMPESAQAIVQVVGNWKTTLASIDRFFKDHNGRGERFLERGKLRDAYLEFSYGVPFKGPEPDRARAGHEKARERWAKLLDVAAKFPEGSRSRDAIVKGLRQDVQGTDYAVTLEQAIQKAGAALSAVAAADTPAASAEKPAAPASALAAAGVAESKSAPAMPAVENKPLAEVIAARVATQEQPSEDAGVDTKALAGKNDERLKDAEKLVQDGLGEFRKATADTMDRGEARNGLLRAAHTKFDKALALLDQATAGKPDAQTGKLMERIGMLMYGCLKYQSL